MVFKTPIINKRRSLQRVTNSPTSSPQNSKKFKESLLSTTIASPEVRRPTHIKPVQISSTQANLFDDNFTQYFQSQFERQISKDEAAFQSNNNSSGPEKIENVTKFSLTQSGWTQLLSDFDTDFVVPAGQQVKENAVADGDEIDANDSLFISQGINAATHQTNNGDQVEEANNDNNDIVQSSQVFFNELNALQLNISSMIDETILANKSGVADNIGMDEKFDVFVSKYTQNEYVQLKRPNQNEERMPLHDIGESSKANVSDALNTQIMEQLFLTSFDEAADYSSQHNECIDPDSSALDSSALDSDGDENVPNDQPISRDVVEPEILTLQAIQQIMETERVENKEVEKAVVNKPVSSATFYSMGPFFGLPLKVKTLIKEFKQIDDLYGKYVN